MSKIKVLATDENKDAHRQGYHDALDKQGNLYPNPVNDYQKEYNRGYKYGSAMAN
jgi:hypothetical protein